MIKIKDGEVRPEGCICEACSDILRNRSGRKFDGRMG